MTDRGITLIELVAAMAIFALVAVMGLQSLTGTLRARDALSAAQAEVAALTRPVAMLRNDLSALVPALFFAPGTAPPRSALWQSRDGTTLALSLAGQHDISARGVLRTDAMHRAIWRVEDGVLIRSTWRALNPADNSVATPEIVVMEGVTGLRVRSYWPRRGWQDGVGAHLSADPNGTDSDSSTQFVVLRDTLPYAVEVTLVLSDGGEIPILETLQ